jgi:phage-related minor tail protein
MAWGSAEYSALGAIIGAIVTAGGAGLVYWQISAASSTLYSANSYTVQKDIIEAADRLKDAQDQIVYQGSDHANSIALNSALVRQAVRFDALIDSVQGLRNNDGISEKTWAHILWWMCPSLARVNYKLGDASLDSTRDACISSQNLWKAQPR